ncbi:MAG: radical SAM protein [Oscillospiraceae bacterium]|nr:radical SAM protein [Oscillospiraceae bacterium]
MSCRNKNRLLLQFHLTGRCNLRCKHCYRTEGDTEPLKFEDIVAVVEQYQELRRTYNADKGIRRRGHINITGGEPFIRKDIKEILRYLGENRTDFSYGVLSNGSFLDDEMIAILKETEVSFVQLSIDGDQKTHDALRAPGDYKRVFEVAKRLEKNKIRTYISFTANKENFRFLPGVARACRRNRITKLWSDRLVPIGNGQEIASLAISKNELLDYVRTMKLAQGNFLTKLFYPKTQVTMNRALQFLQSDGLVYSCSAGDSLITVDEFGQVMPCRRMPIVCGNVFDSTLSEIYYKHEVFQALRKQKIPQECRSCAYQSLCKGGAKCQSHAVYGDYTCADPACPLI